MKRKRDILIWVVFLIGGFLFGVVVSVIYAIQALPDNPSPFFEDLDIREELSGKIGNMEMGQGGPGGSSLVYGVSSRRNSLAFHWDTEMDQVEARDVIIDAFEDIFEERGINAGVSGQWYPPAGFSFAYESKRRFGRLYCVIVPEDNGIRAMFLIDEGANIGELWSFLRVFEGRAD